MNPFIILVALIVAIMVIPAVAPLFRRKSAQAVAAGSGGAALRGPKSPTIVSDVPFFGGGIPEDFPEDEFLRNTMETFVQLQAANDRGNLDAVRSRFTPEVFNTLSGQLQTRGGAPRSTEVRGLKAGLLEVVDAGDGPVASVRLHGQLHTDNGAQDFDEIWKVKLDQRDASPGWRVSGIRPVS